MVIENSDYFINGNISDGEQDHDMEPFTSCLPCSIIVTNLSPAIFDNEQEKVLFQSLFVEIDQNSSFHYFKSFTRVRINFTTPQQAAEARNKVHLTSFMGQVLKCHFTQPIVIGESPHLLPPKREKQFLISPPASPPIGWAPREEGEPIINYDLVSAIANLAPGESHELHPASSEHPAIVVHISEDGKERSTSGVRLPQTRCPNRM